MAMARRFDGGLMANSTINEATNIPLDRFPFIPAYNHASGNKGVDNAACSHSTHRLESNHPLYLQSQLKKEMPFPGFQPTMPVLQRQPNFWNVCPLQNGHPMMPFCNPMTQSLSLQAEPMLGSTSALRGDAHSMPFYATASSCDPPCLEAATAQMSHYTIQNSSIPMFSNFQHCHPTSTETKTKLWHLGEAANLLLQRQQDVLSGKENVALSCCTNPNDFPILSPTGEVASLFSTLKDDNTRSQALDSLSSMSTSAEQGSSKPAYKHCDVEAGSKETTNEQKTKPAKNACPYCDKICTRKFTLKYHIRTHTGERPHICRICFKFFSQRGTLENHKRTHTGEKPYKCQLCLKQFAFHTSLKTHLRTHSGEKPFRCNFCQRSFTDGSTLSKHRRIHSGERPYKCDLCNKRFSQAGNMARHRKTIHFHSKLGLLTAKEKLEKKSRV